MSELIGKTVGQYQIVEQIGAGGMATIFKAFQPSIDRYVAIKILPSQLAEDENFVKRFAHEAKAIAALEHPHILPVHDFGTDGKLNYMVMRYVKGGTLTNLMGKSVSHDRIVKIVSNVASALDYAHERGVVHRDIKPSNILIDEHGEVLLTDFGIAKMVEGSQSTQLTAAGSILGTPAYMSPEQAQGHEIDGRSDIYSLGVVLYELLTGKPPYQAETPFAIVLKHINDPLPPPRSVNPNIPESFERVVLKAMAKDPNQRFDTAAQMADALENALKEAEGTLIVPSPSPAKTEAMPQPATAPKTSGGGSMGPLLIGGAIVVVLLCAGIGGALVLFGLFSSDNEVAATTPTATATAVDVNNNNEEADTTLNLPPPTEEVEEPMPESTIEEPGDENPEPETDVGDGELLFADDFSVDKNNWFIGDDSDDYGEYFGEISDGTYQLTVNAATKDGNYMWVEPTRRTFTDFEYSVEVLNIEHNETGFGYGLVFRSNVDNEYYLFEIDGDNDFSLWIANAEEDWEQPIDYTYSPAINPEGPNELMVRAVGSTLTFFINGQEVSKLEDETFQEGSIGLALEVFDEGGELMVEFDNLAVRPVEAPNQILFADTFNNDANGWATGEFDDEFSTHKVAIEDGLYILEATTKPDKTVYIEKTLPNKSFSDFTLNVTGIPQDEDEHYSYGVAFREDDDGNTYVFEIGNDGLYAVLLFNNPTDSWTTLKDWSSSTAILVGEPNDITVIADGKMLTFMVNGEELTTLEDDTLAEGSISLVMEIFESEMSATVEFENLEVRSLP